MKCLQNPNSPCFLPFFLINYYFPFFAVLLWSLSYSIFVNVPPNMDMPHQIKKKSEVSVCHYIYHLLFLFLRITNSNGLEIRSTGSQSFLTVANVTDDHYGNYTCVATNTLGMTNASLFLFSKYGNGKRSKWISQNVAYLQLYRRMQVG